MNAEKNININIAENAVLRLENLNSDGRKGLRLQVLAGGCNGFQYQFKIIPVDEIKENDKVIIKSNQHFIIDILSAQLINGSTIDFVEDLSGAEFVVSNNPNANSKCGCGNSFSASF